MLRSTLLTSLLVTVAATPALAENWPHWRGPNFDGSASAENLPTAFSKTDKVKWSTEIPPSASTPVIHGKRVYVTTITDQNQLLAICVDRTSGEIRWRHNVGTTKPLKPNRSRRASPSPVAHEKRAIFYYGNGELVAFNPSGKKLWQRNIQEDYGEFNFQWTYGSSPTLYKGRLYVQVLQRDVSARGRGQKGAKSFLLSIDPATGKTQWKHIRPTDAQMESREAYTTPIPYAYGGREQILIPGGDYLTGHDPATGEELWRWGTWNPGHREEWWRLVPSATAGNGVAVVCAPKGQPVYAAPTTESGRLPKDAMLWKTEGKKITSDVTTPLFYQGHFYVLGDKNHILTCLQPKSGKVVWQKELDSRSLFRASPTGADGKIYTINHRGKVYVVDAEDGTVLNRVQMGSGSEARVRASIAVAHNDLFIRTVNTLYCVGK